MKNFVFVFIRTNWDMNDFIAFIPIHVATVYFVVTGEARGGGGSGRAESERLGLLLGGFT